MTKEEIYEMDKWAYDSKALTIHTVYFNPTDYPGQYVVRDHYVLADGGESYCGKPRIVTESLEKARDIIPRGKVPFQRNEQDDSVIVETWI